MKLSREWLHSEFVDLSHISDEEYMETMRSFGHSIVKDGSVFTFDVPENRPDCLSVLGLARESAAAFGKTMTHREPVVRGCEDAFIFEKLDVDVYADYLCNRYTARMAADVKVGPSPDWLCRRLTACGIQPVNNIIDIANYVTLEYGQPIHAFDYNCVTTGSITVREAWDWDTITTPDGIERPLEGGMLVTADDLHVIGLAGITGSADSCVTEETTTVVFEAASYLSAPIRQTAQTLGMESKVPGDMDPMLTVPAIERACELVEMLEAGVVLDGTIDILNYVPQPRTIPLDPAGINRHLGRELPREEMIRYLGLLEIGVEGDEICIPSFRTDLNTTEDIAREVGRFLTR